ncbi:MAG: hypothetical protein WAO10_08940 [Candidatus Sulfotelmatobacter sp.]
MDRKYQKGLHSWQNFRFISAPALDPSPAMGAGKWGTSRLSPDSREGKADLSKIQLESVIVWVAKQKFSPPAKENKN